MAETPDALQLSADGYLEPIQPKITTQKRKLVDVDDADEVLKGNEPAFLLPRNRLFRSFLSFRAELERDSEIVDDGKESEYGSEDEDDISEFRKKSALRLFEIPILRPEDMSALGKCVAPSIPVFPSVSFKKLLRLNQLSPAVDQGAARFTALTTVEPITTHITHELETNDVEYVTHSQKDQPRNASLEPQRALPEESSTAESCARTDGFFVDWKQRRGRGTEGIPVHSAQLSTRYKCIGDEEEEEDEKNEESDNQEVGKSEDCPGELLPMGCLEEEAEAIHEDKREFVVEKEDVEEEGGHTHDSNSTPSKRICGLSNVRLCCLADITRSGFWRPCHNSASVLLTNDLVLLIHDKEIDLAINLETNNAKICCLHEYYIRYARPHALLPIERSYGLIEQVSASDSYGMRNQNGNGNHLFAELLEGENLENKKSEKRQIDSYRRDFPVVNRYKRLLDESRESAVSTTRNGYQNSGEGSHERKCRFYSPPSPAASFGSVCNSDSSWDDEREEFNSLQFTHYQITSAFKRELALLGPAPPAASLTIRHATSENKPANAFQQENRINCRATRLGKLVKISRENLYNPSKELKRRENEHGRLTFGAAAAVSCKEWLKISQSFTIGAPLSSAEGADSIWKELVELDGMTNQCGEKAEEEAECEDKMIFFDDGQNGEELDGEMPDAIEEMVVDVDKLDAEEVNKLEERLGEFEEENGDRKENEKRKEDSSSAKLGLLAEFAFSIVPFSRFAQEYAMGHSEKPTVAELKAAYDERVRAQLNLQRVLAEEGLVRQKENSEDETDGEENESEEDSHDERKEEDVEEEEDNQSGLRGMPAASLRRYRNFFNMKTRAGATRTSMLSGVEEHFSRLAANASLAVPHLTHSIRRRGDRFVQPESSRGRGRASSLLGPQTRPHANH